MAERRQVSMNGEESKILPCGEYDYPGVCKIIIGNDYGTGFLSEIYLNGKDAVHGLFTNNHVVSQRVEITLEFYCHREDVQDSNKPELTTKSSKVQVSQDEMHHFFTCPLLDVTFIEFDEHLVEKIEKLTKAGGLQVEYLPLMHESEFKQICQQNRADRIQVVVPGYPGDETEQEDCDGSKKFAVGYLHSIKGFNLLHLASTTKGSSGSPLLIKDNEVGQHKVVGLHKAGTDKYNVATDIFAITEAIKRANMQENIQPPPDDRFIKQVGMKRRFTNKRGLVYSYISNSSEIWVAHTNHGWHHTSINPAELPENEHMFDFLTWEPLDEKSEGTVIAELANKLEKQKLNK